MMYKKEKKNFEFWWYIYNNILQTIFYIKFIMLIVHNDYTYEWVTQCNWLKKDFNVGKKKFNENTTHLL